MRVVGKCPPESDELEEAAERGFDAVELYLEEKHLDDIKETLETIRNADIEVVSVHTSHSHPSDREYFRLADSLASRLGAYLVFHSQYMHHTHILDMDDLDFRSSYGYENNPGASLRHLESLILAEGHELVLDTAHLYMAHEDYLGKMKKLLSDYGDQINVIHLCDSTRKEDGLPFGEGEMNMRESAQIIANSDFDGIVVLEVMPEHQDEARKELESYGLAEHL